MECDVMSSTLKAVRLERLPGHVALVTINRPDARNAVNAQVAAELEYHALLPQLQLQSETGR